MTFLSSPNSHFSFLNSPLKVLLFSLLVALSIKLLLVPTYHSTDLEVHRNWLTLKGGKISAAETVPIPYFDDEQCSQHTLDYPMLFYYYQYAMSVVYEFLFSVVNKVWIRGLWNMDTSDQSDSWTDWKFWNLKQDEIVRILQEREYQCDGHNYLYDPDKEEMIALNPFTNLKALLLERRPNVPVQYPLPLLFILRMSVILSDIVLYIGLYLFFVKGLTRIGANVHSLMQDYNFFSAAGDTSHRFQILKHPMFKWLLLFHLHPSLLYLDHIHFQYNGMLLGILLISMYLMMSRRYLSASFVFTILLCFKHLYVYVLPAYIVTLLFFYVFKPISNIRKSTTVFPDDSSAQHTSQIARINFSESLHRLTYLAVVTGIVPILSLIPILYTFRDIYTPMDVILQIKSRLFPFHRGLTHSYWAPNLWALYNGADKVLSTLLKVQRSEESVASLTGGLVGTDQGSHLVLPTIRPSHALFLSAAFSFFLPLLVVMAKKDRVPAAKIFLKACLHSTMAFFMFGWHVHEKAIVTAFIPLILFDAYFAEQQQAHLSHLFQYIGTYSLLPLLFRTQEIPIKYALFVAFFCLWGYIMPIKRIGKVQNLEFYWCITGSLALELFQLVVHPLIFGDRMAFLPLMLVSVYCGLTVLYLWLRMLRRDVS